MRRIEGERRAMLQRGEEMYTINPVVQQWGCGAG